MLLKQFHFYTQDETMYEVMHPWKGSINFKYLYKTEPCCKTHARITWAITTMYN
jgi:hypothetical protein